MFTGVVGVEFGANGCQIFNNEFRVKILYTCVECGKIEICWKYILEEDTKKQMAIGQFIDVRYNVTKKILEKKRESGQASNSNSCASEWTL